MFNRARFAGAPSSSQQAPVNRSRRQKQRTRPTEWLIHQWGRMVNKLYYFLAAAHWYERSLCLLSPQARAAEEASRRGSPASSSKSSTTTKSTSKVRIINHMVVGRPLPQSKQGYPTQPSQCSHADSNMRCTGTKTTSGWLCQNCGSRWERFGMAVDMDDVAQGDRKRAQFSGHAGLIAQPHEMMKFGRYKNVKTHKQVMETCPGYCQWAFKSMKENPEVGMDVVKFVLFLRLNDVESDVEEDQEEEQLRPDQVHIGSEASDMEEETPYPAEWQIP